MELVFAMRRGVTLESRADQVHREPRMMYADVMPYYMLRGEVSG